MKMTIRALAALAIIVLCPICAHAQTTTTSGTITDGAGQAYANGSYTISFYNNGNVGPFFQGTTPFNTNQIFRGSLDGTGSFSGVSIPSSNSITPVGTAWNFTVCSAATAPCYTQQVSVTGSTMNVSAFITPPAINVNASAANQYTAYRDSEISGGLKGTVYFNLTDLSLHACTTVPCSSNFIPIQYNIAAALTNANNTFTGNNIFTSGLTSTGTLTCTIVNAIRCVSASNPQGWSGSDVGAWINAAIESLPAAPVGGEVDVATNPAGCYSFATPIVIDRPVYLKGQVGAYNGRGTCLEYTGGATPIISVTTASGADTGTWIENLSIITASSLCTWAVDIDNNPIGVTLENIWVDSIGTNCTGGGFRVGNNSSSIPQNIVFNRVHVFSQPLGIELLSVNSFDCWSCISAENTTANVQLGDSTHLATNVTFHGGDFEEDTTTVPSVIVNNADSVSFFGPYTEEFGGPWMTIPNTATTAKGVHVFGGYFQLNEQAANIFNVNLGAAELFVDGGFALNAGVTSNWVNNSASILVYLENITSTSPNISFATGAGNTYFGVGETNGTIVSPTFPGLNIGAGGKIISSGAGGTMASVIASGTATMTTSAIGAGACGSTVTVSAAGVASTDSIFFSFNSAPAANPAEIPISSWPTSNNVNFQYCIPAGATGVTPNAATLNWRVVR